MDKRTVGGRYTGPPPTIAYMRKTGVTAVRIHCAGQGCHRTVTITFDALGLPNDTPFPSIATARQWVCSRCGSRKVSVMSDWPDPRNKAR